MNKISITQNEYNVLMAMVPQVTIEVENAQIRNNVLVALSKFLDSDGKNLFIADQIGKSVTITMKTPSVKAKSSLVRYGNEEVTWSDLGVEFVEVDPGTGYHIPEGVMYVYQPRLTYPNQIPLSHVKNELIKLVEL